MTEAAQTLDDVLLSVIVRTKDRPGLLAECLESLRRQDLDGMEVLVVNDGGEDVSEVLARFEDSLLIISERLEPSRGRCAAANRGLELASGRWLAFADDDDLWLEGGMNCLLEKAGDADAVLYGGVRAVYYDENEKEGRLFHHFGRKFSLDALLFENFIPIIGCLLPSEAVKEIGGIDESLEYFEDWDLFLRLSDRLDFRYVQQDVAEYRVFDSAFITGAGGQEAQISGRSLVYRKHWRLLSPERLSRMQQFAKATLIPEAVEGEIRSWRARTGELQHGLDDALGAVEEYRARIAERDAALKALEAERAATEEKLRETELLRRALDEELRELEEELAAGPHRKALVSIIIVNYNGLAHLQKCIPSVLRTEKVRYEVIVVDNGSEDDSLTWLRAHYPEVRIVEIGANVGFGEGNRQGVLASNGRWIAFLNNDTVVEPAWLGELLKVSMADPEIGASCSTLRLMQHPEILNGIGGGMSKLGYGYDRRYGCPAETAGCEAPVEDVFFPTAAAMLISRRLFEDEGFDRRIFMYHEDVDLGWRLRLLGLRVVVCRDSIVYHHFGGTSHSAQGLLWRERMGSRHNVRSILKHAEPLTMLKAFKGLGKLWLRMGAYRHIFHVLAWNLYRLPSTLAERRKIQRRRKIRDAELFERGFISYAPYPAPPPEIPVRDRDFVVREAVSNAVLRPADPSSLGRLDFGWYEAHPIEDAMVRPFCGHARCRLKVEADAEGELELRIHVPPEAAAGKEIRVRVNGKEHQEELSGDLWQLLRFEGIRADENGVLEIDIMTPAFRPHLLYQNWDFRRLGGAVRDLRFIPRIKASLKQFTGMTVLITTFRRWSVLERTLDALRGQFFEGLQVLVMDDGSGDETWDQLQRYREEHPDFRLTIARQENTGQGPARNHALELAEEDLILFLGDDIIPDDGFLQAHLKVQNSHEESVVVVGFTDWYRDGLKVTPFMEFVNFEGHQFGYRHMISGEEQPFTCFYTSNISIPREFLGEQPFDPTFSSYGWEDVELGYRLNLRGLRIIYEEGARAGHDHATTVSSFYRRMLQVGRTHPKLMALHPELRRHPRMPAEDPPSWYRPAEALAPVLLKMVDFMDRLGLRFPKKIYHHLMMIPFYRGRREAREARSSR